MTTKHISGAEALKRDNAEAKEKIKLYVKMIEEQKRNIEKAQANANQQEDLQENSVTRKLGHTDFGDISDMLELGSQIYKSQELTKLADV